MMMNNDSYCRTSECWRRREYGKRNVLDEKLLHSLWMAKKWPKLLLNYVLASKIQVATVAETTSGRIRRHVRK